MHRAMFTKKHFEVIQDLEYENSYCLSKNQTLNLTISGLFGDDGYHNIFLRFRQCDNSTDGNICASQNVIEEYLNKTNMAIYAIDNYIQTKNYSSPFQVGYKNYVSAISIDIFLGFQLFLREVDFISDVGLMMTETITLRGFKHDHMFYNQNNVKQIYFTQLIVSYTTSKDTYFRSYVKLQTLAAEIGGIMRFMTITAYVLLYFYCENSYGVQLLSAFFHYNETEDYKDKVDINRSEVFTKILNTNENINNNLALF